jgi:hypothetical protein
MLAQQLQLQLGLQQTLLLWLLVTAAGLLV